MTEFIGIIIAICAGSLTMVGTVITLFLWSRGETSAQITAIHAEMKDFHAEIKDFHGRLCAIEERRLKER